MKRVQYLFANLACLALVCLVAPALVQGQEGDRRGGPGGFFDMTSMGGIGLLRFEPVRKELELVDDQIKKLEAIGDQTRDEMRKTFEGMRDLSWEERQAKFNEMRGKFEERSKELQAKVDEILLPHQRERLNQIRLQLEMRRGGTSGALTNDRVKEALGLTDDQITKLREAQQKADAQLQEKIEKLREEARAEILAILTPEQKTKWEQLVGEKVELDLSRGDFFRGGRGDSGRGDSGRGDRGNRGDRRGGNEEKPADATKQ